MEKYCHAKRRQRGLELLLKTVLASSMIKQVFAFIQTEKHRKRDLIIVGLVVLRVTCRFKINMKKYGGITAKMKNRVKSGLSFFHIASGLELKAAKIIRSALVV